MREPILKGGEGRSENEIEDSAKICGWCLLAIAVVLIVVALPFVFHS